MTGSMCQNPSQTPWEEALCRHRPGTLGLWWTVFQFLMMVFKNLNTTIHFHLKENHTPSWQFYISLWRPNMPGSSLDFQDLTKNEDSISLLCTWNYHTLLINDTSIWNKKFLRKRNLYYTIISDVEVRMGVKLTYCFQSADLTRNAVSLSWNLFWLQNWRLLIYNKLQVCYRL